MKTTRILLPALIFAAAALAQTAAPLTITSSELPDATVGTAYTHTLQASNGVGALHWSIGPSEGPFPSGLTINADTGVVSFTPIQSGYFAFHATVTDSASTPASAGEDFFLFVNPAPLLIATTSPLPAGSIGTSYNLQFQATGGASPYMWEAAGTLPPGLTLSSSGELSGTPTTAGSYSFTVSVTDSESYVYALRRTAGVRRSAAGTRATQAAESFTIQINPPGVAFTSPETLPGANQNKPYTYTLQAAGGTTPYTWAQTSGSLPPGLTFDPETAKISGTPTTQGSYSFWITVRDHAQQAAYRNFSITVGAPMLHIVNEELPDGMENVRYSQTLQAADGKPPYAWSVFTGSIPTGLTLNETTGVIGGIPNGPGSWSFGVRASDSGSEIAMKMLSITIKPAALTIVTSPAPPNGKVNVPYSYTLAAKEGTPPYTWSIVSGALPEGVTLNSSTGKIGGTPTRVGGFSFQVRAVDVRGIEGTAEFSFDVEFDRLTMVTTAIPQGTEGTAYSYTLSATGGVSPYRWRIDSGYLPSGLTLNRETGVISGTPRQRGSETITLWLTDVDSRTVVRDFTVTIQPPLAISTTALPSGLGGTAYSQTLVATGGVTPYTWSIASGTLPAGLTLDPVTGKIGGTPTGRGTSSFTVKVTDNATATATQDVSILIEPGPFGLIGGSLPGGVVGTAYSQPLPVTGGITPYTISIVSGSLPAGLALNGATGLISGTPTAHGTSTFEVKAADSAGAVKQATFSIAVQPAPLVLTTTSLAGATVGSAYTGSLTATGGVVPYTWSVTTGSLPPGVTIDASSGALSGTPTARGTYEFTVQVKCSAGATASAPLSINVTVAPLAIGSGSTLPAGTINAAYSYTFQATGGIAPYTWRLVTGALPAGLSFTATGGVSGTPSALGSSAFTVEVRDSAQTTTAQAVTLAINPPPVSIGTTTLAAGTVGTAYSQTVSASGGTPPYTFSISGGTLPAGLGINAQTGALTGTPTTGGSSTFVVRVADSSPGTQLAATQSYTVTMNLPAAATPTFGGLSDTMNAAQQPAFTLALGTAYPLPLSGTLTLTFAPESGLPDDPAIAFLSGGRTLPFTVAAGQTSAAFQATNVGIQTGTVAGTITITAGFKQGDTDVTPSPAPVRTIRIGRTAPGISSVRATRVSGGLEVQVFGYSTGRDMTQARFRFSAAPGSNVPTTEFTVQIGQAFTAWYANAASNQFGSTFRYVQPFTVQGDTNAITSVEVTLTNSSGSSQAVTANF